MGTTYTRQSSIADGDTITAALFNNEFNQLLDAFAYASSSTTGHQHDGTAAEGGNIHTIGDQDFLNKIVADSTNNRWGVFVEVSSAAVEQIRISDGVISPVTDNDIDLGTSSLEFKDLFLDGTAHVDTLDVDVNATVAGTLGVTGATTLSSTLAVTGAVTGSSTVQGTTITATTAFVPDASDGAALGTSALEFSDLFLADGAVINFGDDQDVSLTHVADTGLLISSTDQLQFGDSGTYIYQSADGVLDLVSDTEIEINATTIDINGNVDVSGTLTVAGAVDFGDAALSNVGAIQLDSIAGDGDTDTFINFGGSNVITIATGGSNRLTIGNGALSPSTDNEMDLGTSSLEFKDAYFDGTVTSDAFAGPLTGDVTGNVSGTAATVTTAAQTNITSLGTLTALTVDDVAINGKVITMTGSSSDTAVFTAGTNGTLSIVTTDDAAAAANIQITADGTVDIDSAGVLTLDSGAAINIEPAAGSAILLDGTISIDAGVVTGATAITLSGELDAGSLDISGDADIDGTLEADAITVDGTALAEFIADTAGAMFSSNTESGIAVTYQDGDNTVDLAVDAAQTGITSIYATDLIIGEDAQTAIDFGTANEIDFKADNAARLTLTSGALYPVTDNEIDLGTSSLEFKDAFFDGTVTSDAFAGPLTGDVTGTSSKVTVSDSTANTNFPVVFHDESDSLLDDTGALRYNPSTGELLVPKLTVAGTTTTADTVTMEASNAIIFEGATADSYETTLSIVDPTADHTQYLINQGGYIPVLAAATTTAITSTPAELNVLDNVTAGTVSASLGVVVDSNKDIGSFRNVTLTGELDAATLDISGNADIDGTTNLDAVDIDGATQIDATVTVGVDDTGYDVKFFGATSGAYMLWDESADDLKLVGAAGLTVAGDIDVDGTTNLDAVDIDGAVQLDSTLSVGVDGTGHDVKFFGDTASAYMLWDQSTDDLILGGGSQLGIGTTTPGHPLHISEAADGTKIQLTRGGVCEWAFSIGNTSTLSGVGAGALEILPLNGGTASEFAVGSAGTTTAILHVKPAAITLAKDTTFSDGADIITASAGTSNFRAGSGAGDSITSGGNYNTVVGDQAGTAITTGDDNTFVGYQAGDALDEGKGNVAIGLNCLGSDTFGCRNIAIGHAALISQNFTSETNAFNIAIGYSAGAAIETGVQNTIIGGECHDNLTTGDRNVAIGYNNGPSAVDVDNEIVIGNSVTGGGTNTVKIGLAGGTATLGLDGSDTSWAAASDLRLKKDVADSTVGLSFINALRPVTFKWNDKNAISNGLPQYDAESSGPVYGEGKAHHGFIAQEVKTVIDAHSDVANGHNIWNEDPDGTQQISQGNLVPMLVKAIQEQQTLIESLTARITTLEEQ